MQQPTVQSVGQRKDFPGQYLDIALVANQYKIYYSALAFVTPTQSVIILTYVTLGTFCVSDNELGGAEATTGCILL